MTSGNQQKVCGFCGERVPVYAGRCPYCGSILNIDVNNDQPDSGGQVNNEHNGIAENESVENNGDERAMHDQDVNGQTQDTFGGNDGYTGQQPNNAEGNQQQRPVYKSSIQNTPNKYVPYSRANDVKREPLSNGIKVLLTAIAVVIPGLGQLIGIIAAIIFMNAEGDRDRKSFGVALLVASLIVFIFACIGCFVITLISTAAQNEIYEFFY